MFFKKISMKNFKPYYGECDANLYDKTRVGKKLTVNMGPTNNGKTSISEAILWCLFGENSEAEWVEYVNDLAIEIAKKNKKNEVDISVRLEIELDNRLYVVMRRGIYSFGRRDISTKLDITMNGSPMKHPQEFLNSIFVTEDLMNYYIFDAEKILTRFEENQEKAIKDNIDKIIGVGIFDNMLMALRRVDDKYLAQIDNCGAFNDAETARESGEIGTELHAKEENIKAYRREIDRIQLEQKKLFGTSGPSADEMQITTLLREKESGEKVIAGLNTKFIEFSTHSNTSSNKLNSIILHPLAQNIYKTKPKMNKASFDFALQQINEIISKKGYQGVLFQPNTSLIPSKVDLSGVKFELLENTKIVESKNAGLDLNSSEYLHEYIQSNTGDQTKFSDLKTEFEKARDRSIAILAEISSIGEKVSENVGEKVRKYLTDEDEVKRLRGLIQDIEKAKWPLETRSRELDKLKQMSADSTQEKTKLETRRKSVKQLIDITDKAKAEFISDLLNNVNSYASDLLRKIVTDHNRFHFIEVNKDYQFLIKNKHGVVLTEKQINTGTKQIALFAFFLSLSKYINKRIPFVIDNPFMRLDTIHDERLINQLGLSENQIIVHLIPGREYSIETFQFLKLYINIQNSIVRAPVPKQIDYQVSSIQEMSPSQIIEYRAQKRN